jgi:hypothetical protein
MVSDEHRCGDSLSSKNVTNGDKQSVLEFTEIPSAEEGEFPVESDSEEQL